jgi:hypothetical protein
VFATVLDATGAYAGGLTQDDFTVLDNGKPQEIQLFSSEAQAISVSVILDTSGSMQAALPRLFAAASVFLDNLRPDDRAMVGTWSTRDRHSPPTRCGCARRSICSRSIPALRCGRRSTARSRRSAKNRTGASS